MKMADINPCNEDYWENKVLPYTKTLLDYDWYDVPLDMREGVFNVHKHMYQCERCSESISTVLAFLAKDSSVANKKGRRPLSPEAFRRLRKNRDHLDNLISALESAGEI